MNRSHIAAFQQTVWDYYRAHGRHDLPWRRIEADGWVNPYHVLVSELMLQQTQVLRVVPKFAEFVQRFPSFASLAQASLGDVLQVWSGLGYNRRAKFLWQAARVVQDDFGGVLPRSTAELTRLPGVGSNTAGALLAYAYNMPVVFVETNIRTVYIYHFFAAETGISDTTILDKVAATLPDNAREWYWALMDYGTHVKQTIGNVNTASKHYTVQSRFIGSRRHIRGQVLRMLGDSPQSMAELQKKIADQRVPGVLDDLVREELIQKRAGTSKVDNPDIYFL